MQLCRLAPPGTKPSAFASYVPKISPMYSFMMLRWKYGGRNVCSATIHRGGRRVRWRREHGEDRRIGMIERDGVDDVELPQVVFVRRVVAVPRHDVERRMIEARRPELAAELRDQLEVAFAILIRGDRRQ